MPVTENARTRGSPYPGSLICTLHIYLKAAGRCSMSPVVTEVTRTRAAYQLERGSSASTR